MSDDKFDVDPALIESADAAREALAEQADALFEALFSNATAKEKPPAAPPEPVSPPSAKPPAPSGRPAPPPPPSLRAKIGGAEVQPTPPPPSAKIEVPPSSKAKSDEEAPPPSAKSDESIRQSVPPPSGWLDQLAPLRGASAEATPNPFLSQSSDETPNPFLSESSDDSVFGAPARHDIDVDIDIDIAGEDDVSAASPATPIAVSTAPPIATQALTAQPIQLGTLTTPSAEKTALPPSVNPAGPSRKEPFIESPPTPEVELSDAFDAISGSPSPPPAATQATPAATEPSIGSDTVSSPPRTTEYEAYLDVNELGLGDPESEPEPEERVIEAPATLRGLNASREIETPFEPPAPAPDQEPQGFETPRQIETPFEPSVPGPARAPRVTNKEEAKPRTKAPSFPSVPTPESWHQRASFLESEAASQADPERRGRTLLIASELWAIAGDRDRARTLSSQATALLGNSTLALRQQRQFAALDQDWKDVAKLLDTEEQTAKNTTLGAHACYLGSEVRRLKLDDKTGASQKLERLGSYSPNDPRPSLMRLAGQLATESGVPKLRFPESLSSEGLPRALDRLRHLRSEGPSGGELDRDPVLAFEDARRALDIGDRLHASQALFALANVEGCKTGANWLAATLLAPSAATRGEAIDTLLQLHEQTKSRAAARALAALALEEGDSAAMSSALGSENTGAFTHLERVLLAALSGALSEELSDLVDTLGSVGVAGACAVATRKALGFSDDTSLTPTGPMAKYSELGHALAQGDRAEALGDLLSVLAASDPSNPLIALLRLERAYQGKDKIGMALRISNWPERDGEPAPYLAAALLHELANDTNGAVAAYRAAVSQGAELPAAQLALLKLTGESDIEQAETLEAAARLVNDDEAGSLLLLEAAFRVGLGAPERMEELVAKAIERDGTLPFGYRLADTLARSRGDVAMLTEWIEKQRVIANSPLEVAVSSVREALLLADEDTVRATACLKEALRAFPRDMALRELFERVNRNEAVQTRWREAAAERARDARTQVRLLLEAAFEVAATDPNGACRLADRARELGPSEALANTVYERLAAASGNAAFGAALALETEQNASARSQRETYERLAELALTQGKPNEAERFWQAILETNPDHLPALRALEQAYLSSGRQDDLAPIAERLALLLDGGEAIAHAFWYTRIRSKQGKLDEAGPLLQHLSKRADAPLWLLRAVVAEARLRADKRSELETYSRLLDNAVTSDDVATICLRTIELTIEFGESDKARELFERALAAVPDHLVILSLKAELHRGLGEHAALAETLRAFAAASQVVEHQVQALLEAGLIWLDQIGDGERGEASLEAAAALAPENTAIFERLRQHYAQTSQRVKLAKLLETRIAHAGSDDERTRIEIGRAKALAEIGEGPAARAALSTMLKANPEQTDALEAYARLSLAEDEPKAAEAAWLQLARITQDSDKQAQHYRNLGDLYDGTLENSGRAALCYREVLKRVPNDVATAEKLINVYQKLNQGEAAAELQARLLDGARSDDERATWTARLAEIYELACHNRDRALRLLQQAREAWPRSATVVRALSEFYLRAGDNAAFDQLLETAAETARRSLAAGQLDEDAFALLVTCAELMGNSDAAKVIGATWATLRAEEASLDGAGPIAGDRAVEEFLAPEPLPLAVRSLFEKAGDALEQVVPPKLDIVGMKPLAERYPELGNGYRDLAEVFGVSGLVALISPVVELDIIAVKSSPPTIVFGEALMARGDQEAMTFLFYRALKLVQAKMCTLSHVAPADRELYLNAFLKAFVNDWHPTGAQLGLLPLALQIQSELADRIDDELRGLAREAIEAVGNRTGQLGAAIERWVGHTALFAVGNLTAALRGLALQTGAGRDLPDVATERLKWVMRTPAARDLVVFTASKEYDAARLNVGLGLDDQLGLGLDDVDDLETVDEIEDIDEVESL